MKFRWHIVLECGCVLGGDGRNPQGHQPGDLYECYHHGTTTIRRTEVQNW